VNQVKKIFNTVKHTIKMLRAKKAKNQVNLITLIDLVTGPYGWRTDATGPFSQKKGNECQQILGNYREKNILAYSGLGCFR